jgi:hypothetical protein
MKTCPCGNEITKPHGRLCEACRKRRMGHGKARNGGRRAGVRDSRQRKPMAAITGIRLSCLCCDQPFTSEHKGNRLCSRCCGHRREDIRDQGRETRRGAMGGAA